MPATRLDSDQVIKHAYDSATEALKVNMVAGSATVSIDFNKVDDTPFTPMVDKVAMVGAFANNTSPDSVNEGDAGALRMSTNRNLFTSIRDGAGNERGVNVTAANELNVLTTAQPGVDIGDVTINNAAGASAVNIQDGGNSITVDGAVAATQSGAWTVSVNNAAGASAVNIQDGGNSITVDGTVSVSGTVVVDSELPAAAALSDTEANPSAPAVGSHLSGFNGTTWDRLRSDTTNGLDVDVTRVQGTVTVDSELPVAATLADAAANPTTPTVGANLQGFNGTTWDRLRSDITNGLDVDVTRVQGTVTVDSELPAASALADATANPTTPSVGSFLQGYNGATWDRLRSSTTFGLEVDANLTIVDLIDGTLGIRDATASNIPGSGGSPSELVASLASRVRKIQAFDTTGGFLGIYTGAIAAEILLFTIGPGSDQTVEADIASGTRISVKRLDSTTALSTGHLTLNFMG